MAKCNLELQISNAQLCFLRERYGKRLGIKRLIELAMLEVVAKQAQQEMQQAIEQLEDESEYKE